PDPRGAVGSASGPVVAPDEGRGAGAGRSSSAAASVRASGGGMRVTSGRGSSGRGVTAGTPASTTAPPPWTSATTTASPPPVAAPTMPATATTSVTAPAPAATETHGVDARLGGRATRSVAVVPGWSWWRRRTSPPSGRSEPPRGGVARAAGRSGGRPPCPIPPHRVTPEPLTCDDARRRGPGPGRTGAGSPGGRNAGSSPRLKTRAGPARQPGGAPHGRPVRDAEEGTGMTTIHVSGLRKTYGAFDAVHDVTFTAAPGRVVGLLGPNGAGKTTTLHVLLGLAAPTAGSATFDGRAFTDLPHPARTVGALLDAGGLHPGRTGRDHLRVLAAGGRVPARRVDEVLALVGMTPAADRRVRTYSLGMRQRLGIAAALLGDPEVLVLDEPANGLDPAGMRWLRDLVRAFADDGGTVLLASHVLSEVRQVADDLVVVGQGRVVADGPLDDLLRGESLEDFYLDLTATTEGVR